VTVIAGMFGAAAIGLFAASLRWRHLLPWAAVCFCLWIILGALAG
jgi:hypothetical protein